MNIQYYVLDNDPDGECLFDFKCNRSFFDLEMVAEYAAEDYESNHDGWEDNWPIDLVVLRKGEKHLFHVEKDYQPVFSAMSMEMG